MGREKEKVSKINMIKMHYIIHENVMLPIVMHIMYINMC